MEPLAFWGYGRCALWGRQTPALNGSGPFGTYPRLFHLKASFVPPRDLWKLRRLTRYRRKMSGYLAGEKNRLQKALEDAGMRLGCVVNRRGP